MPGGRWYDQTKIDPAKGSPKYRILPEPCADGSPAGEISGLGRIEMLPDVWASDLLFVLAPLPRRIERAFRELGITSEDEDAGEV